MKVLVADTATELFALAVDELVYGGMEVQRGRNLMVEAPGPVTLQLRFIGDHLVQHPERKLNPWVSLAEFPWLITGHNDIAWLEHYLPRASDFSDDGIRWRAGYGPRLRGLDDQLAYVVRELRDGMLSRRAVITLWDPTRDHVIGSKDYACTNWLCFQHRPMDVLDLTVGMRSNDLWWGWSAVNVVNWSLLLEAVAEWSHVAPGNYHHVADNLHVYADRHRDAMDRIHTAKGCHVELATDSNSFCGGLEAFTVRAQQSMFRIRRARERKDGKELFTEAPEPLKDGRRDWLADWEYFMGLHPLRDQPAALNQALLAGFGEARQDWQRVAMRWARRFKEDK